MASKGGKWIKKLVRRASVLQAKPAFKQCRFDTRVVWIRFDPDEAYEVQPLPKPQLPVLSRRARPRSCLVRPAKELTTAGSPASGSSTADPGDDSEFDHMQMNCDDDEMEEHCRPDGSPVLPGTVPDSEDHEESHRRIANRKDTPKASAISSARFGMDLEDESVSESDSTEGDGPTKQDSKVMATCSSSQGARSSLASISTGASDLSVRRDEGMRVQDSLHYARRRDSLEFAHAPPVTDEQDSPKSSRKGIAMRLRWLIRSKPRSHDATDNNGMLLREKETCSYSEPRPAWGDGSPYSSEGDGPVEMLTLGPALRRRSM